VILLWGLRGDDPLDDVAGELRRARRPHLWVDQRAVLSTRVELEASGVAGWIEVPGAGFALQNVSALYVRNYDARQLEPVRAGGPEAAAHVAEVESALWCFADVAPIPILNPPSAMASNNSKPYQARLIRAHGFAVPQTLVTTDPVAALEFWRSHPAAIYKSVSGVRSIVTRLSSADLERLADVRWCPTQLQENVEGLDYRVHVVGAQIFATEVTSDAVDYRYAGRQGVDVALRACELPDDVAARCVELSGALGLRLAGIDLRRATDGTWFCFEVNPSPCFTYYERATGQPMTRAVAALLAGSDYQ